MFSRNKLAPGTGRPRDYFTMRQIERAPLLYYQMAYAYNKSDL